MMEKLQQQALNLVPDFIKQKVWPLLQETAQQWQDDKCTILSASMAYYALFSLFPLLLVMLSMVGFFVGQEDSFVRQALRTVAQVEVPNETSEQFDANEQLFQLMRETLSDDAADQIEDTLRRLNEQGASASLIGFLLLAWTASRAFGGLYQAFQIIWNMEDQEPQQPGLLGMVTGFVRKKVLAFLLVLGCGALLLVSMLSSVAITTVSTYAPSLPGDWVFWRGVQVVSTITILTLVFMLLFKYLPDTYVSWGDVWIGGLLTAVLFTLLQQLSSLVIGRGDYQSYGAVGGIMALLLWIYLSSQALFAGVEFTQVYAHMYGSHRPRSDEDEHELKLATAAQAELATEVLEERQKPD